MARVDLRQKRQSAGLRRGGGEEAGGQRVHGTVADLAARELERAQGWACACREQQQETGTEQRHASSQQAPGIPSPMLVLVIWLHSYSSSGSVCDAPTSPEGDDERLHARVTDIGEVQAEHLQTREGGLAGLAAQHVGCGIGEQREGGWVVSESVSRLNGHEERERRDALTLTQSAGGSITDLVATEAQAAEAVHAGPEG